MHVSLHLDAVLGFVRSGLWLGQVVAAAVLLLVVAFADLALSEWAMGSTRTATIALVGGFLVALAVLHTLVSALLLTTRGRENTERSTTSTGVRLITTLVTCAAAGLVGFAAFETVMYGDVGGLVAVISTPRFGTLVVVLAALVVAHAAGSTVFRTVRRTD